MSRSTGHAETIRLYGFYDTTLANYLMLNAIALFGWVVFLIGAACLRDPPTLLWQRCHDSLAEEEWLFAALSWLPALLLVALVYTACEMVVVLLLFAKKGPIAERQCNRRSD